MRGFQSRKFIVTMTGMLLGSALAFLGRSGAEGVLMAGIAAYNLANAYVGGKHMEANDGNEQP